MLKSIIDGLMQTINCFESATPNQAIEETFEEKEADKNVLGQTRKQADHRKTIQAKITKSAASIKSVASSKEKHEERQNNCVPKPAAIMKIDKSSVQVNQIEQSNSKFAESRSFLQQSFRHESHNFSGAKISLDILGRLRQDHLFRQKIDQDRLQNRPPHHNVEEEKDADVPPAQIMG